MTTKIIEPISPLTILEHNVSTNETYEREATSEELTQRAIDQEKDQQTELDAIAKTEAKAALLERLGISEDEAKLLLS